jgi:hypothetical protein
MPKSRGRKLPAETRHILLHGAGERLFSFRVRKTQKAEAKTFPGVIALLDAGRRESRSDGYRARLATFMASGDCPSCHGQRLNARSLAVRVGASLADARALSGNAPTGVSFAAFLALDIRRALEFMQSLRSVLPATDAVREVLEGVTQRLHFLSETGLGYLTLDREFPTLSGGEAQRVRLATQLGMGPGRRTLYVLDEPSIGLHPRDNSAPPGHAPREPARSAATRCWWSSTTPTRCACRRRALMDTRRPCAGTEGGRILWSSALRRLAKRCCRASLLADRRLTLAASLASMKVRQGAPAGSTAG